MTRPALRQLASQGPVHFMGVGGAGMRALAEAVARTGARVSGCDRDLGPGARALEVHGVRLESGHDPAHVEGASALVVTAAVPDDHAELEEARRRSVPVLKRAQALAEWVEPGRVVAVAGTHGKTTTAALLTEILEAADLEPSAFVGGTVSGWGGNHRPGGDGLFVVEADEFDRSFHHLAPQLAVVTNVEPDHLEIYGDRAGVLEAFRIFLQRTSGPDARVVLCGDDSGAGNLTPAASAPVTTYGFSAGCVVRGLDPAPTESGTRFQVLERGRNVGELEVPLAGAHNAVNALGAATAARDLGVEWSVIRRALRGFQGIERRFARLGEVAGVTIVDDYAHHPTEIAAALQAARQAFPGRRLVAVFQPHLFTRTRDFLEGFGRSLALADQVWVTEVYPAREEPIPGVDGEAVTRAVRESGGVEVRFHSELDTIPEALAKSLEAGDVCVTLGAGSVEQVGPSLLDALEGGRRNRA